MARPFHSTFAFFLCSVFITIAMGPGIPWLVHSATLESDIEVLQSLKQAIDPTTIPAYSFLDTWNFQVDPCESPKEQFLGIACTVPLDNSSSRVSAIDLDAGGYDGFLTPGIGDLSGLTRLDLSKNSFRGPIPSSISSLTKLTRLALSENLFAGNIPPGVERLKRLQVVDLSHNELAGSIPINISHCRSLILLRLSNNRFTGRIPDLRGLWQLNTLDLSSNHLNGNLPLLPLNLRTLLLSHNTLRGHISPLKRLIYLKTIDLSDNNLSGTVYQEILTLPEVNHINLSINSFSNMEVMNIPGGATQLRVLELRVNHLHGWLPVNLVTYGNLTSIDLGHNQFSGQIPVEYGQKLGGAWRDLFLDNNFLMGSLPPQFNNSAASIRGSLAQNCLICPRNVQLCHGGQRPASQCIGLNGGKSG